MDNQQFRRLLLSNTARRDQDGDKAKSPVAGTPRSVLGARKHSSIPMTPRQLGRGSVQADFARQLAERNAKAHPQKQARSSAPKGTKLAAGYIDRTKERVDQEDSELVARIKNLEESMKQGEIERETFEKLVQDITGGDVGTTHLVKGLDRKLLERVRRGEDVAGDQAKSPEDKAKEEDEAPALEDAFDELAYQDIGPIVREKAEKKGEAMISPPRPVAGVKRSRNDILKDLKRQREEAAAAAAAEHEKKFPSLGAGFRKINAQGETSRLETDEKGREVLIITTADGKEKRKVRKQKSELPPAPEARHDLDDVSKPINMHNLSEAKKEESEDDDIFEGVGSNYNPLANFDDDDDDDDSDEEAAAEQPTETTESPQKEDDKAQRKLSSNPQQSTPETAAMSNASARRDYFKSSARGTAGESASDLSSADATVRAALAKVRNLDENSSLLQNLSTDPNAPESKEARLKKRAAELAASDRDMEDMDLGFGASRFDDADDMEREGEKVKFSQWKGLGADDGDDDGDGGGRDAKKQRKRGPKKKRGDKNKAEDVLNVMERQKEKKSTLG